MQRVVSRYVPISHATTECLCHYACSALHTFTALTVNLRVEIGLNQWNISKHVHMSNGGPTSDARSLRSRNMENSAGRVHPVF